MKDLIFEGWRRFLNENQAAKALYVGAVVDNVGSLRDQLKSTIKSLGLVEKLAGWKETSLGSHGHEQLNHHMTFFAGSLEKSRVPPDMINQKIDLEIIGFGVFEDIKHGVAAWQVKSPLDSLVDSKNPHITAMLRDDKSKPHVSKDITTWQPLTNKFTIKATIMEVFPGAQ